MNTREDHLKTMATIGLEEKRQYRRAELVYYKDYLDVLIAMKEIWRFRNQLKIELLATCVNLATIGEILGCKPEIEAVGNQKLFEEIMNGTRR